MTDAGGDSSRASAIHSYLDELYWLRGSAR